MPDDRAAQLADVKTIGFAKTRDDRSAARRGGTLPCDERAGIVDREYRLHAEKLDKLHPDEASPAPFERRLGSFGSVVGFVAGYFGELSKGAHEVLAMAAEKIAEIVRAEMYFILDKTDILLTSAGSDSVKFGWDQTLKFVFINDDCKSFKLEFQFQMSNQKENQECRKYRG